MKPAITNEIVQEAKAFVFQLLETRIAPGFKYHTKQHTLDVLANAEKIGTDSNLNEDEMNQLRIAALFHDLGYIDGAEGHETKSAGYAAEFLKSKNIGKTIVQVVTNAILATKIPQEPTNNIAEILCDADMAHLAQKDYFSLCDRIKEEKKHIENKQIDTQQFYLQSLAFFNAHRFKSGYGKAVLEPRKEENAKELKKKVMAYLGLNKKEKTKNDKPAYSRGVESMFRLTARNQINLSAIADNKSNILISVNAILISVILSVLVTRFSQIPQFIVPTIIFLFSCVLTIVFAILSTRPNISSGRFSRDDIADNKVNLLFFGNFYNMELNDYEWAIEKLMQNDSHLYSTMIKDQFYLGKILAKKYKLLKIAYNVFLAGVVLSVMAFAWVAFKI